MNVPLGNEVGYTVRFEDKTLKDKTRIKYVTEGILLKEIQIDPLLTRYSVIMIDEAHERSMQGDILLALLRYIRTKRPELRIIIASATIEANRYRDFFRMDETNKEIVTIPNKTKDTEDEDEDTKHATVVDPTESVVSSLTILPLSVSRPCTTLTVEQQPVGGSTPEEELTSTVTIQSLLNQAVMGGIQQKELSTVPASSLQPITVTPSSSQSTTIVRTSSGRPSRWGSKITLPLTNENSVSPLTSSATVPVIPLSSTSTSTSFVQPPLPTLSSSVRTTSSTTTVKAADLPQPQTTTVPSSISNRSSLRNIPIPTIINPELTAIAILALEGRTYPVEIEYSNEPVQDYLIRAAEVVYDIHTRENHGDILIFLPGSDDIRTCIDYVNTLLTDNTLSSSSVVLSPLDLYPLHSHLPFAAQQAVFEPNRVLPSGTAVRKAIFCTNIAETSLTIPNIAFVIDSGYTKQILYNAQLGISSLLTVPVSRMNAVQRSGRAGRIRRGKCFRLYQETVYHSLLPRRTSPEIVRTETLSLILQLFSLGIYDIVHFPMLDYPLVSSLIQGLEQLYALGAIQYDTVSLNTPLANVSLTPSLGLPIADLPIDPRIATFLIEATHRYCAPSAIKIAAMITQPDIFITKAYAILPLISSNSRTNTTMNTTDTVMTGTLDTALRTFGVQQGDLLTFLNIYNAYIVQCDDSHNNHNEIKQWCLLNGLVPQAMTKAREMYRQLYGVLSMVVKRYYHYSHPNIERSSSKEMNRPRNRTPLVWTLEELTEMQISEDDYDPQYIAKYGSKSLQEQRLLDYRLRTCFLHGFPLHIAKLDTDGNYLLIKDNYKAKLYSNSIYNYYGVPPTWLMYHEVLWIPYSSDNAITDVDRNRNNNSNVTNGALYIKNCTLISPWWLLEEVPHAYETKEQEKTLHNLSNDYVHHIHPQTGSESNQLESSGLSKKGNGRPQLLQYRSAAERAKESESTHTSSKKQKIEPETHSRLFENA